ncbi:hypothetical protein DOO78_18610 [Roseicella frigidaeris]|uniref:IrrE N-terminal-like domain-containing protein n=2 Tax=Roseicella frigidaeris TaxID=2230885 RepID=A0A327M3U5_9PROT|nr:hypothetical protein DOO78_18610 [Roseicella frigidaeris]
MERLAGAYGVPLYALFNDAIPNLEPLPHDFRKRNPTPAALSPRALRVLFSAEKISTYSRQLAIALGYRPRNFLANIRDARSPDKMAMLVRSLFDDWLGPRASILNFFGAPEQKFASALRLFFEGQGVVLNVNDAPEDYMGFYVNPDAGLPTIFVSRSILSRKAQLFTLAHEIGHFLLGLEGVSNPFEAKNDIERSCNVFAAEFLAPRNTFSQVAEGFSRDMRADTRAFISATSARTLLSRHAAGIRLVELGYISRREYLAWREDFLANPGNEKEIERKVFGNSNVAAVHAKRLNEIGYLSVFLSKSAIDKNIIDAHDVVEGIGLSIGLQQKAFSLAARRIEAAIGQ